MIMSGSNEITPNISTILPPELWMNIFDQSSILNAEYLWTVVRHVSTFFRDCIERQFASSHLLSFAISLSLPRRDPGTSAVRWQGAVPRAQMTMSFDFVVPNLNLAIFTSPIMLEDSQSTLRVEELRDSNVLPKERLQAASAWVFVDGMRAKGIPMYVTRKIEWDSNRNLWMWEIAWRTLVSRFYQARRQRETERLQKLSSTNMVRINRRWPSEFGGKD